MWQDFISRSTGRASGVRSMNNEDAITISHVLSPIGGTAKNTAKKKAVQIRIGANIVAKMRWQLGDNICLVCDGNVVGLKRAKANAKKTGWALCKSGASKTTFRMRIYQQSAVDRIQPQEICSPLIDGDVVILFEESEIKIKESNHE